MAEDNPFLSFFESMGTGMEAGAERRSLMQRAERGQLEPGEEVPGLGRTILKGITRAATPANTRLAQDQFRVQTAQYALENTLAKEKQQAAQIKQLSDLSIASTQAGNEKNDAALLASSEEQAREAFVKGGMDSVYGLPIPKFAGADSQKQYTDFLKQLDGTSFAETASDMKQLIASASDLGISSEGKSRLVLQAEIQGRLNQYTQNPTQIRQMLNEMRALQESGDTTGAQIIGNYMTKLSAATGKRMEVGRDGRVIIAEGAGVDPSKPLTTAVTGRMQQQAITASSLLARIDSLDQQVTPETVGFGGFLSNLRNIVGGTVAGAQGKPYKDFRQDVASTKQSLDSLQNALSEYIREDSGNMSDKDLNLLLKAVPRFDPAEPYQTVKTKISSLKNLFLLKDFIARKELGTLSSLLRDQGATRFADSMSAGLDIGFEKSRLQGIIRKAIDSTPRGEPVFPTIKALRDKQVLTEEEALRLMIDLGLIGEGTELGSEG